MKKTKAKKKIAKKSSTKLSARKGTNTKVKGTTEKGKKDADLNAWQKERLAEIRTLIMQAHPNIVEETKWRGVPVWSCDGIICTGETYKQVVKMTFAKGAHLADPSGLFNSSLEGNTRRAIDFREGDKIDKKSLKALVLAAVKLNASSKK